MIQYCMQKLRYGGILMNVARRVARLRITHGESLREAARRTGVSHTTILRIEKGEVTGSFHETLQKIAAGYGTTLEYLLTGQDATRSAAAPLPPVEPIKGADPGEASAFLRLAEKCSRSGLSPSLVELTIDLLQIVNLASGAAVRR